MTCVILCVVPSHQRLAARAFFFFSPHETARARSFSSAPDVFPSSVSCRGLIIPRPSRAFQRRRVPVAGPTARRCAMRLRHLFLASRRDVTQTITFPWDDRAFQPFALTVSCVSAWSSLFAQPRSRSRTIPWRKNYWVTTTAVFDLLTPYILPCRKRVRRCLTDRPR